MHEDLLRIGQVASDAGVSIDTIRYYERLGLLPRAARTRGGFRLYSSAQVTRLRGILEAKRLGLTLQQIRELFDPAGRGPRRHCQKVRELLDARLRDIDQSLEELRQLRGEIAAARAACEGSLNEPSESSCPVVEDLGRSRVPDARDTRRVRERAAGGR